MRVADEKASHASDQSLPATWDPGILGKVLTSGERRLADLFPCYHCFPKLWDWGGEGGGEWRWRERLEGEGNKTGTQFCRMDAKIGRDQALLADILNLCYYSL